MSKCGIYIQHLIDAFKMEYILCFICFLKQFTKRTLENVNKSAFEISNSSIKPLDKQLIF